jgi:diguanylate cyclase
LGREPYFGVTVGFANGFTAIRAQALTDPLIGLANRRHFDERLAHAMVEAERGDRVWSLLIADVDHFKTFNDTYGHLLGDQVLRLVASVLIQNTKGQDLVARYAGDEFAVILPNTHLRDAKTVAENFRKAITSWEVIKRRLVNTSGMSPSRSALHIGMRVRPPKR